MTSDEFWTSNQVGGPYATLEESRLALDARSKLYPTLYDLMPVDFLGKIVLDYGCGPGHDVILFAENRARRVFYHDVSPMAIEIVEARLELHGLNAYRWFGDFVDHIHCAGVLHHTEDPLSILRSFKAVLRLGGEARVMVYDGDVSDRTQSKVPVTTWWTKREFVLLCLKAGFSAEHVGGYDCSTSWRPNCTAMCWRLTHGN